MIVTFCGHSDFNIQSKHERFLMALFDKLLHDTYVEFYLGGYGQFDSFAFSCAKKFKQTHCNASLIFVSPYIKINRDSCIYDDIIYPELENIHPKYAILERNKYMIKKSDLVFAYVNKSYGGAYKAYIYAKKLGKKIINLAECFDCFPS